MSNLEHWLLRFDQAPHVPYVRQAKIPKVCHIVYILNNPNWLIFTSTSRRRMTALFLPHGTWGWGLGSTNLIGSSYIRLKPPAKRK